MAYIYKKVINGRPYYYLRVSKRINGKVVIKDVAYLGNDISKIRDSLDKLPENYRADIRKAYSNIKRFIESNHYLEKAKELNLKRDKFLDRDLLEKIEAVRLHFNQYFLKLDKKTRLETFKDFLIDFAYNTTSLEGNTITFKEANRLLKDNLTPKERTLGEIFDLQNTQKAFLHILESRARISHKLITNMHKMLMENIDSRVGYRTYDVRVFRSRLEASPARYVKADMDILLRWYEEHKGDMHPLVLATLFHQKFEKIHPFFDGNGRTGRMLMNYILMNSKYPPFIVQKKNRSKYLYVLSKADKSGLDSVEPGNFRDLLVYISREFLESYWNNFNV